MGLLTKCGPTKKKPGQKSNTTFDCTPVKWFWQVMFGNSSSKAPSMSAIATGNYYKFDFYLKQLPWKIACGDLHWHHGAFSASLHLYEGIHYRVGNTKGHSKSCTAAHRPMQLPPGMTLKSVYCTIGRATPVNAKRAGMCNLCNAIIFVATWYV